ncbi:capsule biosynthesis protein [Gluconobacter wancherniae]|uniref:capsule biosynthesis protein n=1 Tax=Gluconobacter wancherniae TaxID=1307955 RepID=UPI001B8D0DFB|nr:capsular biosynthesis protein [Gluconobacter wancherniae]MBS1063287.1 capsular biosynthesis protein [Gluconobacter wancherniae]MBS1088295.1 capsular biosynthesis protein [Gluconobacter wancherniae]
MKLTTTSPLGVQRNILLLQGLMGPFFRLIGRELRRRGYGVWKVNFNGGDRLFWRLPGGIDFTGRANEWPDTLAKIIVEHDITDVMLFGDCRPLHSAAIAVCTRLHIPVHVFEEGYLRPDWVTFELGGVNGNSTLSRDPNYYRRQAQELPPASPHVPVASSFRTRALQGLAYNTADLLARWHYPHWNNYRPWHPLTEGIGWLRKLIAGNERRARSQQALENLRASGSPYMLFPLQLDADAQVRLHSSFSGMAEAIRTVIASFAAYAPNGMVLAIKEHPLDNNVRNWRHEVAMQAAAYGVADRVDYFETGDITDLVKTATGVITINSTTGTLALAEGKPVITLGSAVYDIPGITFQGALSAFWSAPGQPDKETFNAYRRVLIDRCLIPGGFFSDEGMHQLVSSAIDRLTRHSPRDFAAASQAEMARREALRQKLATDPHTLTDVSAAPGRVQV